jgi:hypothetical protein
MDVDTPAMKKPEAFGKALESTLSPDESVSDSAWFPLESSLSASLAGSRPEARLTILRQAEGR